MTPLKIIFESTSLEQVSHNYIIHSDFQIFLGIISNL